MDATVVCRSFLISAIQQHRNKRPIKITQRNDLSIKQLLCHMQTLPLRRASTFSKSFLQTIAMKVVPVPVREDNYAYLLIDEESQTAAAVDPFDVAKVASAAETHSWCPPPRVRCQPTPSFISLPLRCEDRRWYHDPSPF